MATKRIFCANQIILIVVILIASNSLIIAQTKGQWTNQLAADIGVQLPMSAYDEPLTVNVLGVPIATTITTVLKPSLGISAIYYYRMSDRFFLSVSAGILTWGVDSLRATVGGNSSSQPMKNTTLSAIPLNVGIRYNFATSGLQPYVGLESGVSFFRLKTDSTVYSDFGKMRPSITPKVGIRYPFENGVDLDLNLKYLQTIGDANFSNLGINIGIAYTFREIEERSNRKGK